MNPAMPRLPRFLQQPSAVPRNFGSIAANALAGIWLKLSPVSVRQLVSNNVPSTHAITIRAFMGKRLTKKAEPCGVWTRHRQHQKYENKKEHTNLKAHPALAPATC
jgi:hypothetical protein